MEPRVKLVEIVAVFPTRFRELCLGLVKYMLGDRKRSHGIKTPLFAGGSHT